MTYGYIRVSTDHQEFDRQENLLQNSNYEFDEVHSEVFSGKTLKRPVWKALLEKAKKGDIIVVESLSRVSRSAVDTLLLLTELTEKGIFLVSLKEQIDMTTVQGRVLVGIMAVLNQMEREIISERTKEGLRAARKKGVKLGRPSEGVTEGIKTYLLSDEFDGNISRTSQLLDCGRQTVYNAKAELYAEGYVFINGKFITGKENVDIIE